MMNKKEMVMDTRFMNAAEVFGLVKSGMMNDDEFYEWLSVVCQDAFHEGVRKGALEGVE
jgi:hypothetical protein